jgi:hypothetical protein
VIETLALLATSVIEAITHLTQESTFDKRITVLVAGKDWMENVFLY